MTVRTVDTSLNGTFALDSRSCDLTSISNKLIGFFFTNSEVNFLYARFICINQWILWQSLCFRRFTRYHGWFSCTNFDNLRYGSQGFFIRKFLTVDFLTVRTVDTSLNRALTLNTRSCDLTSISNKLIGFFFTNAKVNFLNPSFVGISEWILWQSVCFWRIAWYHSWLSCADFDNLCYWIQGFFIRKFLAVNNLTIGTVDTGLDRALSLNTWCCDLAGILDQFIRSLLFNVEGYFLYTSFVGISQRILWQNVCFRSFIRYHSWLSCADFDNLCYRSQGFFIR